MSKLDWRRAHLNGRATEAKYRPGTVLPNGVVITAPRKDNLAYRADRAMRAWQQNLDHQERAEIEQLNKQSGDAK